MVEWFGGRPNGREDVNKGRNIFLFNEEMEKMPLCQIRPITESVFHLLHGFSLQSSKQDFIERDYRNSFLEYA